MTVDVPGIPFPLTPVHGGTWHVDADVVRADALPRTDIFIDPSAAPGEGVRLDAMRLVGAPGDDVFQLVTRVTVGFADDYDAGVLLVWFDDARWAKLCFEYSPDGDPMIVSVVNDGVSDDANGFVVDGRTVWLRISRMARTWAFHASLDGERWELVRHFRLDAPGTELLVGLEAQSPSGDGCPVAFDGVRYTPTLLAELRDGA